MNKILLITLLLFCISLPTDRTFHSDLSCLVHNPHKVDCGWIGINQQGCEERGDEVRRANLRGRRREGHADGRGHEEGPLRHVTGFKGGYHERRQDPEDRRKEDPGRGG